MHILLTDVLTCPRCGPEFGLIVVADRIEDRRVIEGRLGCANCREEYLIQAGIAHLRSDAATAPTGEDALHGDDEEVAFRAAALIGLGQGTGTVLLVNASPELVDSVGRLLPNAQVVGASRAEATRSPSAGWTVFGRSLPFRDRSLRGLVVFGPPPAGLLAEAARVLAPDARVVLTHSSVEDAQRIAEAGLTVILEQEGVLVASAPGLG